MKPRRVVLSALILTATVAFVVGTASERNSGRRDVHHVAQRAPAQHGGESAPSHAEAEASHSETPAARTAPGEATHGTELKPLGIDIEAAPFVALAAAASIALGLAAYARPRWTGVLVAVAIVMLAFAVLDVREIFHQGDEGRDGLAVFAGVVAALHLAAAVVALMMVGSIRMPWSPSPSPSSSPPRSPR